MPPLKEIYTPPPPPPPQGEPEFDAEPPASLSTVHREKPEKPKVQPREVARKAVTEIKKTPPKLFLYSIAGAVGNHSAGGGLHRLPHPLGKLGGRKFGGATGRGGDPVEASPKPAWNPAQPPVQAPAQAQPEQISAGREAPPVSVTPKYSRNNKKKVKVQAFRPDGYSRANDHQLNSGRRGSSH